MTTLPARPGPNHSASSGARARIGVAWAATRYGESEALGERRAGEAVADDERRHRADGEPERDLDSVVSACGAIVPSAQAETNRAATTRAAAG